MEELDVCVHLCQDACTAKVSLFTSMTQSRELQNPAQCLATPVSGI